MPPRRTQKATVHPPPKRAKKGTSTANKGKNKRDAVVVRAPNEPALMSLSRILGGHPVDVVQDRTLTTASLSCGDKLPSFHRLASILHGVFLVTMTTKAQIGVFHVGQSITAAVDERWLEALVRYCGVTVLAKDIIETAAAFSDWLQVFVSLKQHEETQRSPLSTAGEGASWMPGVPKDIMVMRLKLLRQSVPSVQEAEAFLRTRWGQSEGWRCNTMNAIKFITDAETVAMGHFQNISAQSEAGGPSCDVPSLTDNDKAASDDGGVGDEELLAQISKELRATLSEEKLRHVVAQMRREAMGLDAMEQELVTRRQQRERLLATYDLVRVILGERRCVCSMTQLVRQMVAQNRFRDGEESVLKQLASLARYGESGITIFAFSGSSEERHPGGDVEGGAPSFCSREVDVSQCSTQELEAVLLRLDRQVASRAKLYAALQRD